MLITDMKPSRNRFSLINPGKMGKRFFYCHVGDGGDPPADKFTLDEAKEKLKSEGFTVMKQSAFDSIIDEKYTAAFRKAKEELGDASALKQQIEELKTQNEELKKKASDKNQDDVISKTEHEKLLDVERNKAAQKDEVINRLRDVQKDNAILKAAQNSNDPETVVKLLRDQVKIDDEGNIYPVDDKGDRLIDSEGHVSVEKHVTNFLSQKTYLAKASDSAGAGSGTSSQGGKPATGLTPEQLADLPMSEFKKVGGISALSS